MPVFKAHENVFRISRSTPHLMSVAVALSNRSYTHRPLQENFVLLGHVQREVKAILPPLFLERECKRARVLE